jgi:hypothetical protein
MEIGGRGWKQRLYNIPISLPLGIPLLGWLGAWSDDETLDTAILGATPHFGWLPDGT